MISIPAPKHRRALGAAPGLGARRARRGRASGSARAGGVFMDGRRLATRGRRLAAPSWGISDLRAGARDLDLELALLEVGQRRVAQPVRRRQARRASFWSAASSAMYDEHGCSARPPLAVASGRSRSRAAAGVQVAAPSSNSTDRKTSARLLGLLGRALLVAVAEVGPRRRSRRRRRVRSPSRALVRSAGGLRRCASSVCCRPAARPASGRGAAAPCRRYIDATCEAGRPSSRASSACPRAGARRAPTMASTR